MDPSAQVTPSLFPLETCPPVTDEAFNLFHSIDRELYTRLIQNLGREPFKSMKVMAFWMWLEREGENTNLIRRMLSLPLALLNELADETLTCLKCVENDKFLFVNGNDHQITLLPDLLSTRVISLRFFYENRIAVLHGVGKIFTTVCSRAFTDILLRVLLENAAVYEVGESSMAAERKNNMPMMHHPHLNMPPFYPPPPLPTPPPRASRRPPVVEDAYEMPVHVLAGGGFARRALYDSELERQMLSDELGDLLSRNLLLEINGDLEEEVLPDDRTIFLTFSKGYPITEAEVREFFTRRFGDFIEDLIMQEVGEDEQVLYARMVARTRSASVIDAIVGGNKAKYSINGKHVWARKYVKRQQQQQQHQTTSSPRVVGDQSPSAQAGQGSTLP